MHDVLAAGTTPYVFCHDGQVIREELLQQSGTAFGLRYDMEYRVHRLDLKSGRCWSSIQTAFLKR